MKLQPIKQITQLKLHLTLASVLFYTLAFFAIDAQAAPLRRPLSPTTPMYMMQLYTSEDTQTAINAIPPDIKPYVVVVQTQHADPATVTNGFELADQFLSVCYSNGVWAMVQASSGYLNNLSNTSTAQYETLFQRYPNLIGFGFAEQNWGFATTNFQPRLELLADLLVVADTYGGYLYVSEMQSISNSGYDPIAKLKTNQHFRDNTKIYKTNYIVGSKFTSGRGYYDNESVSLGVYLSGHAGNYAVRFDETAWGALGYTELYGLKNPAVTNGPAGFTCPEAAHGIPIVDHVMLQGATVIDGPEFPQYTTINQGRLMPCFNNTISDVFRKVLDKTIKIPSLGEVLSNTPIAYVCDQNNNLTGGLYDGLYQIDGDGGDNHTWFKSQGRYSSVPGIFTNAAYELSGFATNVLQSQYTTRWPTLTAKLNEFNSYFPSEYTGSAYVARRDNHWFTYNNYLNSNVTETASIPLQYNTCSNLSVTYPPQTFAVITESNQNIQIYFNNYFTDKDALWVSNNVNVANFLNSFIPNPTDNTTNTIRTTVFQISGCTSSPTYTLTDRGSHIATADSSTFASGVFTLTLTGNGPCDININCSGNTSRPPVPPSFWTITPPPAAPVSDPPSAPTGLSATTISSSEIDLLWGNGVGAASYNIKRSTVSGGPYTTIAASVLDTSFADTSVAAYTTYFYVASSVNALGESINSSEVIETTAPVVTLNIGAVADSYVNDGGSANNNYGTATSLRTKGDINAGSGYNRIAYYKFDVHDLTNTVSAKVILTTSALDNGSGTLSFEWVTNNSWTESGITWNNQPGSSGVVLETVTGFAVGTPVTVDVTSAALSQAAKDGYLSMLVADRTYAWHSVEFASKEHTTTSWRPILQYSVPSASLPNAPTALTAQGGNLVVNLNWTQSTSSGITGNNVYRSITGSGGPYSLQASLGAATSYSDTAVAAGNTYFYSVTAVNADGESSMSAYSGATTVPPVPTGLISTAGNNQAALNWNTANGASSYNIKRATTSGGPYTVISNSPGTTYTDTSAVNGTTYYYAVSAVNSSGESANSSEASATPQAPAVPAAPTNLSASAGRRKVTLGWTPSASPNIATNNVYRATVSGGPFTKVAVIAATTSYVNSGLTTGTKYYYVVTAVNNNGLESPYSNQTSATSK